MFARPLQWGTINLGALVLYRFSVGSLSKAQWRDVLDMADLAVLIMLRFGAAPDVMSAGWLNLSAGARAEIHQATGMVLAQLGVGAQEAMARMRAHAFAEERLLVDVARDVVTRRLHFSPDMT
jgi:ANTAR domain